jgi:hypothetical protein
MHYRWRRRRVTPDLQLDPRAVELREAEGTVSARHGLVAVVPGVHAGERGLPVVGARHARQLT